MTNKDYFKTQSLRREQRWSGVSKHRAKNKTGNNGIHPRNGQIEGVWIEAIFNRPGWVNVAHK